MKRSFFTICNVVGLSVLFFSCYACAVNPAKVNPDVLTGFKLQDSVLLADRPSEDINGFLPDQIYVKTLTQTFCRDYQFCLVDGRIYYKSMPDAAYSTPGKDESIWTLVNGTGLPYPKNGKDFDVPKRITEISADADSLFVFSSDGEMYQMFTNNNAPEKPFVWLGSFGWPEKIRLTQNQYVKNKRGWSSGTRRQDVLWHEDIFGNPHHYGTMGIETLYFLTEDGQHIRFTDSGLPADFSRSLQGPEDGAFIAENISASASTMFLIDKAGRMYTRLADFDTIGCDPMFFRYTYDKLEQKYTGYDYLSNYAAWGLPSEPWRSQPEIPLEGKARLTRFITILQNGHGNAARELRVAGLDSAGQPGYYSKQIMDEAAAGWTFVAAPLSLPEDSFLPVTAAGIPEDAAEHLTGERQEIAYKGFLWQDGARNKGIECSVPDFSMSDGECTLFLTYKDETKQVMLYPVEIWSYMFRSDPGFDGTTKNFFITFSFEPDLFESAYPEFTETLERLFKGKHHAVFSSKASATEKYFKLSVEYRQKLDYELPLSARIDDIQPIAAVSVPEKNSFVFFLTNTRYQSPVQEFAAIPLFYDSPILQYYYSEALWLPPGRSISITNRGVLDRCVEENQTYLKTLQNRLTLYKKYAKRADLSRWGYNVVDLFTTVTFLNQLDFPKIKTVTSFGNQIMDENADTYKTVAESNEWAYSHMFELLELRINAYESIQHAFAKGAREEAVPDGLRNTYIEYYADINLPRSLAGVTELPGTSYAAMYQLTNTPMFPGFCVMLGDEDSTSIFVELKDSAETVFSLKHAVSKEHPVSFPAKLHVFTDRGGDSEIIKAISGKSAKVIWDGTKLSVTVRAGLFGSKTVFAGSTGTAL